MKRPAVWLVSLTMIGGAVVGTSFADLGRSARVRAGASAAAGSTEHVQRALTALGFVENRGQTDGRIRYSLAGRDASVLFGRGGPTYVLPSSGAGAGPAWVVKPSYVGGRTEVQPVAAGPSLGSVSYFHGQRSDWITGVPTFPRVTYPGVWPGIDVVYSTSSAGLEYSFVIHPGADPGAIAVAYRGASTIALRLDGGLRVETPAALFDEAPPVAFQTVGGRRATVPAAFDPIGERTYRFRLGGYDPTAPLVIDPAIGFSGYIGGAGQDQALAVAVGSAGATYAVGQTKSTERTFPVKVGPDLTENGQTDAFVCKVTSGGQMSYCGFIGGEAPDRARGVAVGDDGSAYVYGWTRSRNKDGFPVTVGPDLTYNGGTTDTFLCKVDPSGTTLVYCGYIGGNRHDEGKAIDVDAAGAAYITGGSKSADLPVNAGFGRPFQGNGDVFIGKVRPDGTGLDWLGYVGGAASEHARGVAVDAKGAVTFAGTTRSTQSTLPVKVGPDLTYNGGGGDAFVGRISPDASSLQYLGYVGGAGFDDARDAVGNPDGTFYLCGHTASTQATFPVKVGPDLTYNGGKDDAFVTVVSPAGKIASSGYIGGRSADSCYGIDADRTGKIFVGGHTYSTQSSFPVKLGPDLTYNGESDAFVAEIASGHASLAYCGYVGGIGQDVAWALAIGPNDEAILAGATHSGQGSFPVKGGPDLTYNGGGDAFVTKVLP